MSILSRNPSPRKLAKPRVGPRMADVRTYVAQNPGQPMIHAARYVAPNGTGLQFGYQTVHRAVKAGIVRAVKAEKGNATLLYPVEG